MQNFALPAYWIYPGGVHHPCLSHNCALTPPTRPLVGPFIHNYALSAYWPHQGRVPTLVFHTIAHFSGTSSLQLTTIYILRTAIILRRASLPRNSHQLRTFHHLSGPRYPVYRLRIATKHKPFCAPILLNTAFLWLCVKINPAISHRTAIPLTDNHHACRLRSTIYHRLYQLCSTIQQQIIYRVLSQLSTTPNIAMSIANQLLHQPPIAGHNQKIHHWRHTSTLYNTCFWWSTTNAILNNWGGEVLVYIIHAFAAQPQIVIKYQNFQNRFLLQN